MQLAFFQKLLSHYWTSGLFAVAFLYVIEKKSANQETSKAMLFTFIDL